MDKLTIHKLTSKAINLSDQISWNTIRITHLPCLTDGLAYKNFKMHKNGTYYEVTLFTKLSVSIRRCEVIPAFFSNIGRKYVIKPFPLSWPY